MNKKTTEPVYRDTLNHKRWRFIKAEYGKWLMTRIKDGYRSYWSPEKMVLEETK